MYYCTGHCQRYSKCSTICIVNCDVLIKYAGCSLQWPLHQHVLSTVRSTTSSVSRQKLTTIYGNERVVRSPGPGDHLPTPGRCSRAAPRQCRPRSRGRPPRCRTPRSGRTLWPPALGPFVKWWPGWRLTTAAGQLGCWQTSGSNSSSRSFKILPRTDTGRPLLTWGF